ncbi:MAG: type II secretion system protein [Bacillota bacterium]|nr:type II secretion system protein [Bacillota bacterium]
MIRTQRGISLIELLVTLAILSVIGTIIWSVFFQGYKYSQKAVTKNRLQQEANLVIVNLTKIHQTSLVYSINNADCKITVNFTKKQNNSQQSQVFEGNGLCYTTDVTGNFDPNQNDNDVKVTVYDQNDRNNKAEVDTFLYRLK